MSHTITVTLTASDIQSILDDVDSSSIVESISFSQFNRRIDIDWNVQCDPVEFEMEVEDVVDISEHEELQDKFDSLTEDYEKLDTDHQDLNEAYDELELKLVNATQTIDQRDEELEQKSNEYQKLLAEHLALEASYEQVSTELTRLKEQANKKSFFKRIFS